MKFVYSFTSRFRGFTLIELLAVMGIFASITAAVAVAYPGASVRLRVSNIASNLRGDLRQAQLSASSVSSQQQTVAGYGLVFSPGAKTSYQLFVDKVTSTQVNGLYVGNKKYDGNNENSGLPVVLPDDYAITDVCVSAASTTKPFNTCRSNGSVGELAVLFVRPSAQPQIYINAAPATLYTAACIQIEYGKVQKGSGYVRNIMVTRSGLISVSLGGCHGAQIVVPPASTPTTVSIALSSLVSGIDLAVDVYGNAYVANSDKTITKVTPSNIMSTYATLPFTTVDLRVDTYGTLYSHELDGSSQSIVTKVIPGTTPFVSTLPTPNPKPTSPTGFAVDQYGYIYQVEGTTLWIMDPTNGSQSSVALPATSLPVAIATDSTGNVYTANSDNTVTKISSSGVLVWNTPVGLNPKALTVDNQGIVYTANYGDNTVSKITAEGLSATSFATVDAGPVDITTDAVGNVYTANGTAGTVSKITSTGATVTVTQLLSTGGTPTAVESVGTTVYVLYGSTNTLKKVVQ